MTATPYLPPVPRAVPAQPITPAMVIAQIEALPSIHPNLGDRIHAAIMAWEDFTAYHRLLRAHVVGPDEMYAFTMAREEVRARMEIVRRHPERYGAAVVELWQALDGDYI